jgi:hypothetical protein
MPRRTSRAAVAALAGAAALFAATACRAGISPTLDGPTLATAFIVAHGCPPEGSCDVRAGPNLDCDSGLHPAPAPLSDRCVHNGY